MKILSASLGILFMFAFSIRGEAGVIPYSLIQNEMKSAKTEKAHTCEDFKKRQAVILKKISDLRTEENHYLEELEKLGGNYCLGGQ